MGSLLESGHSFAQNLTSKDYFKTLSDIWANVLLFDCGTPNKRSTNDLELLLTAALTDLDGVNSQRSFCDLVNDKIFLPYGRGSIFAVYGAVKDSSSSHFVLPQRIDDQMWYWDTRGQSITLDYPVGRIDSVLQGIPNDTLIIDLRSTGVSSINAGVLLLSFFVQDQLLTGPETEIVHEGWSEGWPVGYNYAKKWTSTPGRFLYPINKQRSFGKTVENVKVYRGFVVALTNAYTLKRLGPILDALQSQGNFFLVHEKEIPETVLADQVQYFDSVFVEYNSKNFFSKHGGIGCRADKEVLSIDDLTDLIGEIRADDRLPNGKDVPIYPTQTSMASNQFKDSLSRAERLTGLAKIYTILRLFYPFFDENKIDLGERLKQFYDKCDKESDTESFYRLLCEYVQPLQDSHITIWSHKRGKENAFTIPARFEKIEGKTIVVETIEDSTSDGKEQLRLGTEILKIGNQSIDEYETEWLKRIPASSPNAALRNLYSYVLPPMSLCGQKGSTLRLLVRKEGDRSPIELTLRRNTSIDAWYKKKGRKPKTRSLENGILYIDLSEVYNANDFESCLKQIDNSRSVIFDLRKRPKWGSVKGILSPFLSGTKFLGWEEIPLVKATIIGDALMQTKSWKKNDYWFMNENAKVCDKPLVVLINEYSQSGTEDLADSFKMTGHAIFVGSQTAGTTGAIAVIHIPNFGYCSFTGCLVKDSTGQPLYRRGVSPTISVRPTLEGIRLGKDEVLEAAIKYLSEK